MSADVAVTNSVTACVICAAGAGSPYRVSLSKGLQTVHRRCLACGRTWKTTDPAPVDFLTAHRPMLADPPKA
jgi:hypothetical protein